MTINELFEWAKAHHLENANIYVEYADGRIPSQATSIEVYPTTVAGKKVSELAVCLCFMERG